MSVTVTLEFVQLGVCLFVLGIASYQDIRERMVYDWVWVIGLVLGSIMHVFGLIFYPFYSWQDLIFNLFLAVIFVGLFSIPKLFGQPALMGPADLLGILVVAYVIPVYSSYVHYFNISLYILPVVTAFLTNLGVVLVFQSLFFALLNIYFLFIRYPKEKKSFWEMLDYPPSVFQRIILFLIGIPMKIKEISKYKFLKLLFAYDEEEKEYFLSFSLRYDDELDKNQTSQYIQQYSERGGKFVWVSPLLPLVVHFTISVVLTFIWGNCFFRLLESFV